MTKTNGQILYEHHHPSHVLVIEFDKRRFATEGDAWLALNPKGHTPWRLLTKRCQESWEETAVGHWLFSKEPTC